MEAETETLRREIAFACRVMAHRGLVEEIVGHISVRVGEGQLLIRCRGPQEPGLRFTSPDDIRLVDASTGQASPTWGQASTKRPSGDSTWHHSMPTAEV